MTRSAATQGAPTTADLVGLWRLVGGSIVDEDGIACGVPYGPQGRGLLSLSADGLMMAVLVDACPPGEADEREFASYCGTYTFDGAVLTTTTYASSDPARFASPQIRHVRLDDDRLTLVPPPVSGPGGRSLTRTLVWERISAASA